MSRGTAARTTGQHEDIDRLRRLASDHRILRERDRPSILRSRLGSLPQRPRSADGRSVGAGHLSVGRMALASRQPKGGMTEREDRSYGDSNRNSSVDYLAYLDMPIAAERNAGSEVW